jgi:REP element-mobilizing transposase RayT
LNGYDYAQGGAYFVTIVAQDRRCMFGNIECGEMYLSPFGNIIKEVWQSIPFHFPQSTNDHFMIMPNHIHGIIELVGARHAVPHDERFGKPVSGSIPTIIRSFKSESTRKINLYRKSPGGKVWQRNFYEHVIRNEKEFQAFYDYIYTNPLNWSNDDEYVVS